MSTYSRKKKAKLRLMAEMFDTVHDQLTLRNHGHGLCRLLYQRVWAHESKYSEYEWRSARIACVHLIRRSLGNYLFLESWARARGHETATTTDFFAARRRWAKQLAAACREAGES